MSPQIEAQAKHVYPVLLVDGKKEHKDSNQNLQQLAALLGQLEAEVASATGLLASNQKAVTPASGGSDSSEFEEAMAQLALVLQLLEVEIAKADHSKAQSDYAIARAQMELSSKILEDVVKKIKKLEKAESHASKLKFWSKVIEIAMTVIVSAIALAFGQVEIAILMVGMTALSTSGAIDKASAALSEGLQDLGLGKMASDILSKVIVLVVVIALTAAIAPTSAADAAVDTGAEVGEEAIEGSAAAVREASIGSSPLATAGEKINQAWKTINLFNRLSVRANLVILNTIQTVSQLNVTQIVQDSHLSAAEKRKIDLTLTIVIAVTTILATIGSGSALAESSAAAKVEAGGSRLARLLKPLTRIFAENLDSTTVSNMENLRRVLSVLASEMQLGEGLTLVRQGQLNYGIAQDNAHAEVNKSAMDLMNSSAESTLSQDTKVLGSHAEADKNFQEHFLDGYKGFTELLTTYSPV